MSVAIDEYDVDYVCSLDESSLQKAKKELFEDPKNRLGAVKTLRDWIISQEHISCPTDTHFLLKFLRCKKFSQLESRKLLENYLKRRQQFSLWFQSIDTSIPEIDDFLGDGGILVLPNRDQVGRRIWFLRPGCHNMNGPRLYRKEHYFQSLMAMCDWIYSEELTQVHGSVTILDMSGFTGKHQSFAGLEDRKNFIQTWQKNYPARIKEFNMYNCGLFTDFVVAILKLGMSEKMQNRIIVHGSNLEGIYKHVDKKYLPEEYLPDDYTGPNAGSTQEIIAYMKEKMMKGEIHERIKYLSDPKWRINFKAKSKVDIPNASFRKLNVD